MKWCYVLCLSCTLVCAYGQGLSQTDFNRKLTEINNDCSTIEKEVEQLKGKKESPTRKQVHDLILRMVYLNDDMVDLDLKHQSLATTEKQNRLHDDIQERMMKIVKKLADIQNKLDESKRRARSHV